MCGITGIYAFNEVGRFFSINLAKAVESLKKRGPDFSNMSLHHKVNLGHTRLSIIDLSFEANQPMKDESGRYTIIFNGEIYNYQSIRQKLSDKGINFKTHSDTEAVLKAYIHEGEYFINQLQGFFAFAIYDEEREELFLARDRMGIKPLLIYQDEDKLIFGSEMKALLNFNIPKELDYVSLKQYLQFNYIPAPETIFRNVRKLKPGHYLKIIKREITEKQYYEIPKAVDSQIPTMDYGLTCPPTGGWTKNNYEQQKEKLLELLEASVQKSLIADVPLGAFLSGGIDSSVITALASRHTQNLHTFSIGYRDEPFFDETKYARLVAKKFHTQHTVFSLSNEDLYEILFEALDYIDEPFADSSALALYILSKKTRSKVKAALSGDGADELFSGYNKHSAEYRARKGGWKVNLVQSLLPFWQKLPKSRNGYFSNKIRQFERFAKASSLSEKERYWTWATFATEKDADNLLSSQSKTFVSEQIFKDRKEEILKAISDNADSVENFNEVLYTDLHLVLESDMLHKVDMMSMANGLEVRVPFLDDHELVNFVSNLPVSSKIDTSMRKKILQDTFRDILPKELYRRPKHGFEIPLLKWLRGDLKSLIEDDLLNETFIREQGIFDIATVRSLKQKLFSTNPEDVHARIWGLLVFQYWWKKWLA